MVALWAIQQLQKTLHVISACSSESSRWGGVRCLSVTYFLPAVSRACEQAECRCMRSQVPLFASLTPAQRSQLCTALKPMHVRGGTAIVRAGDVGDTFYVVEAGACSVVNEARQARPLQVIP